MRFYHLARQSHVLVSTSLNAFGKLSGWEQYGLLESIARPKSRFVRASSSEMHGQAKEFPSTRLAAFTLGAPWTDGVNAKDTKSYYPTEVNLVIGDPSKAKRFWNARQRSLQRQESVRCTGKINGYWLPVGQVS
jgi:GDP-D-mannose dehydratase